MRRCAAIVPHGKYDMNSFTSFACYNYLTSFLVLFRTWFGYFGCLILIDYAKLLSGLLVCFWLLSPYRPALSCILVLALFLTLLNPIRSFIEGCDTLQSQRGSIYPIPIDSLGYRLSCGTAIYLSMSFEFTITLSSA